jgi:hypothetical protein
MSYSRINYLKKVKQVCELYQAKKVEDVPISITFLKHIEPVYPMHVQTFYKFLSINYERELKKLLEKKANKNVTNTVQPKLEQ